MEIQRIIIDLALEAMEAPRRDVCRVFDGSDRIESCCHGLHPPESPTNIFNRTMNTFASVQILKFHGKWEYSTLFSFQFSME